LVGVEWRRALSLHFAGLQKLHSLANGPASRDVALLTSPRDFVPFSFVPSIFYVALQQTNRGYGTQRFT
jgi:hypothetical protein